MNKSTGRAKMEHSDWRAWARFLDDIDEATKQIGFADDEEIFYRGHADSEWKLEPTLIRDFGDGKLDAAEGALFWEFHARARELHLQSLSDWDVLFYMRHHYVPTRLLDWTETLGVALYFALETFDKDPRSPCIWLLNPYKLNQAGGRADLVAPRYLYTDDDDQEWDYGDLVTSSGAWPWKTPLAIYPQQRPARMGAQRGWFTIHGESKEPIEKQCPKCVARVPISVEVIPAARRFLTIAGIDPYGIYTDLDALAETVVKKNQIYKGRR